MRHATSRRAWLVVAFAAAILDAAKADPPEVAALPTSSPTHRFSKTYLNPPELQFGCSGIIDGDEESLAKLLAEGKPHQKLAAARDLWDGHSRRQAASVIKYLAGPPPGGNGFRELQRDVDAALEPKAILRELESGDYLWGTWLAFLRPSEALVPALLKGMKDQPPQDSSVAAKGKAGYFFESMLALGNSGDVRAAGPLLELLGSDDDRIAGDAAKALGYLALPATEPRLIEALAGDNNWAQVNACGALGMFGSPKALPALKKLAEGDEYTGALNVKGMAEHAIGRISERQKP